MAFLNEYEKLKLIGKGSFATIWKVRHLQFGYIRAIKVSNEIVEDENDPAYQSFVNECKVLLQIGNGSHPNIVHIYQPRLIENRAIVEMDCIEGETMENYLSRVKFVTIKEFYRFFEEIVGALAYCHHDIFRFLMDPNKDNLVTDPNDGQKYLIDGAKERELVAKYGVTHNDIHSNNIMRRSYDGHFTLLDFGISIQDGKCVKSSSRQDGALEYMAPEKFENANRITKQSDIYGLGVLLYEVLAGRVPFVMDSELFSNNPTEASYNMMTTHKTAIPPSIEALRRDSFKAVKPNKNYVKDYPDWIEAMIMKCLEKNPENRYQDAKELLEDFLKKKDSSDDSQLIFLKNENKQLESQVSFLTTDNTLLKDDNDTLKKRNELLSNRNDDLTAENASHIASNKELQKKDEKLQKQVNELSAQYDTLKSQNQQLKTRVEEADTQNAALQKENEQLASQNKTLTEENAKQTASDTEREQLASQNAEFQNLNQELQKQVNDFSAQYDTLKSQNQQLKTRVEEADTQNAALQKENEQLANQNKTLAEENAKQTVSDTERQQLASQNAELGKQNDALQKQVDSKSAECETLKSQNKQMTADSDKIQKTLEKAQSRIKELEKNGDKKGVGKWWIAAAVVFLLFAAGLGWWGLQKNSSLDESNNTISKLNKDVAALEIQNDSLQKYLNAIMHNSDNQSANLNKKIEELNTTVAQLKTKITNKESAIEQKDKEIASLKKKKSQPSKNQPTQNVSSDYQQLKNDLKKLQGENKTLKRENETLNSKIENLRKTIKEKDEKINNFLLK